MIIIEIQKQEVNWKINIKSTLIYMNEAPYNMRGIEIFSDTSAYIHATKKFYLPHLK